MAADYTTPTVKLLCNHNNPLVSSLARQVSTAAELLQLDPNLLEEPISPGTQDLVQAFETVAASLQNDSVLHKQASSAATRTYELRGLWAILSGEEPTTRYEQDCLTLDMNDITIKEILVDDLARMGLGPKVLGAPTTKEVSKQWSVQGYLWMHNFRPFFTLIVEIRHKNIKVELPFLVDTGRQRACLNEVSWKALLPGVDLSNWTENTSVAVEIHDVPAELYLGMGRTRGVNMVGKDWLRAARAQLICDYGTRGAVLRTTSDERIKEISDLVARQEDYRT